MGSALRVALPKHRAAAAARATGFCAVQHGGGARTAATTRSASWRELLRKDPGLTVSEARAAWPFPPGFMDRLADGLTRAGVPRA